jgi:hypothetical protein
MLSDRNIAFPRPKSQNRQNITKSAKVGFEPPQSEMELQSIRVEQNKCLPSRDRTAGLKITIERDLLHQLQSCALPAELRRVIELSSQLLDEGRRAHSNIYLNKTR